MLIENFRPGTMEGWGLGWEALHALNPRLVMLRVSGYGQTGPYRDRPGFGVVGEAMGGLRHLSGEPGRTPVRVGISIGDTLSALHGVIGMLLALRHRDQNGGEGQMIDVALYESVFNVMESLLPEYSRVRRGASAGRQQPAGHRAEQCLSVHDGKYALIAGNGDGIFRRLMDVIDRPDLRDDPALAQNDGRVAQVASSTPRSASGRARRSLDEVLAALNGAAHPGRQNLRHRRHRRRPALPCARHDSRRRAGRRHAGAAARHRPQTECDAGQGGASRRQRLANIPTRCCKAWASKRQPAQNGASAASSNPGAKS